MNIKIIISCNLEDLLSLILLKISFVSLTCAIDTRGLSAATEMLKQVINSD